MFPLFFIVLWLTVWYTRWIQYAVSQTHAAWSRAAMTASLVTWLAYLFIYNFG